MELSKRQRRGKANNPGRGFGRVIGLLAPKVNKRRPQRGPVAQSAGQLNCCGSSQSRLTIRRLALIANIIHSWVWKVLYIIIARFENVIAEPLPHEIIPTESVFLRGCNYHASSINTCLRRYGLSYRWPIEGYIIPALVDLDRISWPWSGPSSKVRGVLTW
jgi:hypothetical protein